VGSSPPDVIPLVDHVVDDLRKWGEEGSGKAFGLEVPVPSDAPVHDRLAGFFGRDPG
jgi:hypothetical protein